MELYSSFEKYDSEDIPIVRCIKNAPKNVKQSLGIIEEGTDANDWSMLMKISTVMKQAHVAFLVEILAALYHIKRIRIAHIESNLITRQKMLCPHEEHEFYQFS